MLIPFESGTHLRVPPGTDVVSMELSPDGKLYAVASPSFLQIWSACSELILLNQVSLQRSDSASAEQLRRVFVVWRSNSRQLAVVCGEGIVLEWDVEYEEYMFEQHHKNDTSIYLPSCKLTALPKRNVDEYGEPLCVSSTPNSILLGTAAGNLVEIEWSGISRGYPISAPIMIFLPEVSKVLPDVFGLSSIDYDPYLKLLAVAACGWELAPTFWRSRKRTRMFQFSVFTGPTSPFSPRKCAISRSVATTRSTSLPKTGSPK